MAHQVLWTDELTEKVIKYGALSEELAFVLRTRARGYTVSEQAEKLNVSERTVARMVSKLKQVYDAVQKEHPEELPVRKVSKVEQFMDEN